MCATLAPPKRMTLARSRTRDARAAQTYDACAAPYARQNSITRAHADKEAPCLPLTFLIRVPFCFCISGQPLTFLPISEVASNCFFNLGEGLSAFPILGQAYCSALFPLKCYNFASQVLPACLSGVSVVQRSAGFSSLHRALRGGSRCVDQEKGATDERKLPVHEDR